MHPPSLAQPLFVDSVPDAVYDVPSEDESMQDSDSESGSEPDLQSPRETAMVTRSAALARKKQGGGGPWEVVDAKCIKCQKNRIRGYRGKEEPDSVVIFIEARDRDLRDGHSFTSRTTFTCRGSLTDEDGPLLETECGHFPLGSYIRKWLLDNHPKDSTQPEFPGRGFRKVDGKPVDLALVYVLVSICGGLEAAKRLRPQRGLSAIIRLLRLTANTAATRNRLEAIYKSAFDSPGLRSGVTLGTELEKISDVTGLVDQLREPFLKYLAVSEEDIDEAAWAARNALIQGIGQAPPDPDLLHDLVNEIERAAVDNAFLSDIPLLRADPEQQHGVGVLGLSGVGKSTLIWYLQSSAFKDWHDPPHPQGEAHTFAKRLRKNHPDDVIVFDASSLLRAPPTPENSDVYSSDQLFPAGQLAGSSTATQIEFRQGSRFETVFEYYSETELRKLAERLMDELRTEEKATAQREIARRLIPLLEGADSKNRQPVAEVERVTDGLEDNELPIREKLLRVAGKVFVVPAGMFGNTAHFADFAVCRFVAHALQGMELNFPTSWRPVPICGEAADATMDDASAGAVVFDDLWTSETSEAVQFGKSTAAALKRVTQWSQARFPAPDLPLVDLPGVGDGIALNDAIRSDELEKLRFVLLVFDAQGVKPEVLRDLCSWQPLLDWEKGAPLPFAIVINIENGQEAELHHDAATRWHRDQERLKSMENVFCDSLEDFGVSPDRANAITNAAFPDAVVLPCFNALKQMIRSLRTPEGAGEHHLSPSQTSEIRKLLGVLARLNKRNAGDRLQEAAASLENFQTGFSTNVNRRVLGIARRNGIARAVREELSAPFSASLREVAKLLKSSVDNDNPAPQDSYSCAVLDKFDAQWPTLQKRAGLKTGALRQPLGKGGIVTELASWNEARMQDCLTVLERRMEHPISPIIRQISECLMKIEAVAMTKNVSMLIESQCKECWSKFVIEEVSKILHTAFKHTATCDAELGALAAYTRVARLSKEELGTKEQARALLSAELEKERSPIFQRVSEEIIRAIPTLSKRILGPKQSVLNKVLQKAGDSLQRTAGKTDQTIALELMVKIENARGVASISDGVSLEDEGKPILEGLVLTALKASLKELPLLGASGKLGLPKDSGFVSRDKVELFDPVQHLELFENASGLKVTESAFADHDLQLKRRAPRESRKQGLASFLGAIRHVWSAPPARLTSLIPDVQALLDKWRALLPDAYRETWSAWPEWLHAAVVLVDFYARPLNIYVVQRPGDRAALRVVQIAPVSHGVPDEARSRSDAVVLLSASHKFAFVESLKPAGDEVSMDMSSSASSLRETLPPKALKNVPESLCVMNPSRWARAPGDNRTAWNHAEQPIRLTRDPHEDQGFNFPHFGAYATYEHGKPRTQPGEKRMEDALALSWDANSAVCCDGVGDQTLPHSGEWARHVAESFVQQSRSDDSPLYSGENRTRRIFEAARIGTRHSAAWKGSTTMVSCALARVGGKPELHCMSFGDTVAGIVRGGKFVWVSPTTWYVLPQSTNDRYPTQRRGTPLQLACRGFNPLDAPNTQMGQITGETWYGRYAVEDGDMLVMATDGILDNLQPHCTDETEDRVMLEHLNAAIRDAPERGDLPPVIQLRNALVERAEYVMNGRQGKNDDIAIQVIEIRVGGPRVLMEDEVKQSRAECHVEKHRLAASHQLSRRLTGKRAAGESAENKAPLRKQQRTAASKYFAQLLERIHQFAPEGMGTGTTEFGLWFEDFQVENAKTLSKKADTRLTDAMDQYLGERQLIRKPVPGDGACQFHALSRGLARLGKIVKARKIREEVVGWLERTPPDTPLPNGVPISVLLPQGDTWASFCRKMRRDDCEGEQLTLTAAATLYQMVLHVVSVSPQGVYESVHTPIGPVDVDEAQEVAQEAIKAGYCVSLAHISEVHYDAIEPADQPGHSAGRTP